MNWAERALEERHAWAERFAGRPWLPVIELMREFDAQHMDTAELGRHWFGWAMDHLVSPYTQHLRRWRGARCGPGW
jgi:hypothetical protein